MDNIRPIETEADYDWALKEIARYFDNEPLLGTPEADRFNVLADLIEHYESKHWRIEAPDPVSVIKYFIAQKIHTQTELAEIFGSRSRASEVLNRKRPLTLEMVRALSSGWKLPVDLLVQPYALDQGTAKRKAPHAAGPAGRGLAESAETFTREKKKAKKSGGDAAKRRSPR